MTERKSELEAQMIAAAAAAHIFAKEFSKKTGFSIGSVAVGAVRAGLEMLVGVWGVTELAAWMRRQADGLEQEAAQRAGPAN